jgi:N-acyl-D-aspartate/D-glutamate deacylase
VTSVVIENCGFGFAPCKPADRERATERNEAVPLACMREGMPWGWERFPEFLDSLDATPKGVNLLAYVGLNPLMAYVMGLEPAKSRPANEDEQRRMCDLLGEAIDAGARGFSAQVLGETSVQRDFDGTREHAENRLLAVQCLDLGLLVDAEHHGVLGRIEIEAD